MSALPVDEPAPSFTGSSSVLRTGLRWLAAAVLVAALARVLWTAFKKKTKPPEDAPSRTLPAGGQPAGRLSTAPEGATRSVASPASSVAFLRVELLLLGLVVLIAVGVRIAWVAYLNIDPNDGRLGDSVFLHNAAHLLANGDGYMNIYNGKLTAHMPPAFPATLAVVYKLFGWHVVLAKVLNVAFAAVTVVLVYLIGRCVFDRRVAVIGALVLALFPGQIYVSTLVYAETMFAMFFMLVLLLALVWTIQRPEARSWQVLLIGILVGVSALVRVEGVVLILALMALWLFTVRPWRRVARYGALALIGTVLALTPWTVRNAIQFHEFIPLRANAGGAIARALDPEVTGIGGVNNDEEAGSLGEGLRYQVTHPRDIPGSIRQKTRAFYENDSDGIRLISHPGRFPAWVADLIQAGVVRLPVTPPEAWFTSEYEPPLTQEEVAPWRRLADRYFFAAGAAALVAAAVCLVQRRRAALVLLMPVLVWTVLFSFVYPATRYHFPLGPVFAILAGAFLVFAWDGALAVLRWVAMTPTATRPQHASSSGSRASEYAGDCP